MLSEPQPKREGSRIYLLGGIKGGARGVEYSEFRGVKLKKQGTEGDSSARHPPTNQACKGFHPVFGSNASPSPP